MNNGGRTSIEKPPLPKLLNPFKDGQPYLANNPAYYSLTRSEWFEARERLIKNAVQSTYSSWPAVFGAGFVVFGLGCWESSFHLRPIPSFQQRPCLYKDKNNGITRLKFVVRYGIAQMIPSILLHSQPSSAVADAVGLDQKALYKESEIVSTKLLRRNLLFYLRGSIAGGVLFSQIITFTHRILEAGKEHSTSIMRGRASPFETSTEHYDDKKYNSSNMEILDSSAMTGKVIRLCGSISDVSVMSMRNLGRDKFFPIFEDGDKFLVKALVREHSITTLDNDNFGIVRAVPTVPVYWQVTDGTYYKPESWKGMHVPYSWLFDIKEKKGDVQDIPLLGKLPLAKNSQPEKLLILEADTTPGDACSMTFSSKDVNSFDLDLLEVVEGFKHLVILALKCQENIAKHITKDNLKVLRVMLLDSNSRKITGSGKELPAHEFVEQHKIADVIIDSNEPILRAMKKWIEADRVDVYPCWSHVALRPWTFMLPRKLKPVILETTCTEWFVSIRNKLQLLGYDAIGPHEAFSMYKIEDIAKIPFFIYERTSPDTVQAIQSYQALLHRKAADEGKALQPPNGRFCALCPSHDILNQTRHSGDFAFICSSQIYDYLFSCVRWWAQHGMSNEDIKFYLESDGLDLTLAPYYEVLLQNKVDDLDQPDDGSKLRRSISLRNEARVLT